MKSVPVQGIAEKIAEKIAEEIAEEIAEKIAEEIAEEIAEKIAEGILKDIFPLLFSKDSVLYSKEKRKDGRDEGCSSCRRLRHKNFGGIPFKAEAHD